VPSGHGRARGDSSRHVSSFAIVTRGAVPERTRVVSALPFPSPRANRCGASVRRHRRPRFARPIAPAFLASMLLLQHDAPETSCRYHPVPLVGPLSARPVRMTVESTLVPPSHPLHAV
jgi:hypothetical protein